MYPKSYFFDMNVYIKFNKDFKLFYHFWYKLSLAYLAFYAILEKTTSGDLQ